MYTGKFFQNLSLGVRHVVNSPVLLKKIQTINLPPSRSLLAMVRSPPIVHSSESSEKDLESLVSNAEQVLSGFRSYSSPGEGI